MLYNIIGTEFKDGFPKDIKVIMSDRFQVAPGILYLDMSKYDQKYLSRQLHTGLRRASQLKERYLRARGKKTTEEISDQDKAIEKNVSDVIDSVISKSAELENWVQNFQSKINKVPESQKKKFDEYFGYGSDYGILDKSKKLLKAGISKKIPGTMDREMVKYVKLRTLDMINALIQEGGLDNMSQAEELRNKLYEFDDAVKSHKKSKKSNK
jgi:hypothetical protein